MLGNVGYEDLKVCLSECLPETNSVASMEWDKARIPALLASRRQTQWTFVIESLGEKFCRALPLGRVVSQGLEVYEYEIAFQEVVLSKFSILSCLHKHTC